jgi:hypothetical protein
LGSFCNFDCGGERRGGFADVREDHRLDGRIGLESFQLLQTAVERALDARVVTGEPVELGLEIVVVKKVSIGCGVGAEFGFHAADPAQVPGRCDELVEQGLLEHALRSDVVLEFGGEGFEFFTIFWTNDEVLGGEAVLAGVLGRARFAFIGSRAGAELRIGDVGGSAGGGWVTGISSRL